MPITVAAPYHAPGPMEAAPHFYGRFSNPTWTALELALGELEGGQALVFASGMAAVAATLRAALAPGGRLVMPTDGYPGIRAIAEADGLDVRAVPTDTEAIVAACPGAALVWVETPSNPALDVCDIAAVVAAAHAAGALLAVDNSLATPLGQQPLALGADLSVTAGTKALAGHSDVLLGVVAARDPALLDRVLAVRTRTGAVLGPFEAWIARRSLATLDLRLERSSTTALALAQALRGREDVTGVVHPSLDPVAATQMARFGPLVGFDLGTQARAQAFLARSELILEATSFGGVHTTAERRGRLGTDAVGPGFIRLSAGVEDPADVLDDVERALDGA